MPKPPKYYNPLQRKFMFLLEHNATNFLSNTYELWGFFFCLQKPIFNTVTPVTAATVAPILATNSAPSATTTGKIFHPQRRDIFMQFITVCTPKQDLQHIPKWPVALLSLWQCLLTPMLQLWPPLLFLSVSTTHSLHVFITFKIVSQCIASHYNFGL